jgi:hypothetical protein
MTLLYLLAFVALDTGTVAAATQTLIAFPSRSNR